MNVRQEVIPFIFVVVMLGLLVALICIIIGVQGTKVILSCMITAVILIGYLLYFFRDPERIPPDDETSIVAGADGKVMKITELEEEYFLKTKVVRVSIFLSLFNVHVNRSPISGSVKFLGYFPGKRFFTFQEKSSDFNQHNSILIEGKQTRCLINQIVGPVCRRVVHWLVLEKDIKKGARIGMMKFGSRLDMYFPKDDVEIVAKIGDKVRAGETVVAELRVQDS